MTTSMLLRPTLQPKINLMAAAAQPSKPGSSDFSMADLMAQLSAASGGSSQEVHSGYAPLPQNVGILPATDDKSAVESYGYLVEMSSLAALYTSIYSANIRSQRGHPELYNITVAAEATQEFADLANASYQVMTLPLAGFYTLSAATQYTFNQKMSKTEVHLEFLGEIFKDFNLTDVAMKQLDGVLTKLVASLKTITVSTESSSNTVDQTLRINQVMRINIAGSKEHPIWVYQPRTRLVYMHIDASSYKWATNKADHQSSTFSMRYVVVDGDLNVNKYLAAKPQLDQIFQKISGQNLAEFGKMVNPDPVKQKET